VSATGRPAIKLSEMWTGAGSRLAHGSRPRQNLKYIGVVPRRKQPSGSERTNAFKPEDEVWEGYGWVAVGSATHVCVPLIRGRVLLLMLSLWTGEWSWCCAVAETNSISVLFDIEYARTGCRRCVCPVLLWLLLI